MSDADQCNTVNVNQSGFNLGPKPSSGGQNEVQHETTPSTLNMYFYDSTTKVSPPSLYRSFSSLALLIGSKLFESIEIKKKSFYVQTMGFIVGFDLFTAYRLHSISCNLKPLKLPARGSLLTLKKKGNRSKIDLDFKELSYNCVPQRGLVNVGTISFTLIFALLRTE